MALDRVYVSTSVTRNLGDYNSIKQTSSFETDVKPKEDVEDAYNRAWVHVEREVEAKIVDAIEAMESA